MDVLLLLQPRLNVVVLFVLWQMREKTDRFLRKLAINGLLFLGFQSLLGVIKAHRCGHA